MYYQLPNGKVVSMTIEEYLNLTDEDIQYLMSIDYGEYVTDPFKNSAVDSKEQPKVYDFDFLPTDDEIVGNIPSEDTPFDDIIDLGESDI